MEPARGERERREREREERSGLGVFRFHCEAPTVWFTLLKNSSSFFFQRELLLCVFVLPLLLERGGGAACVLFRHARARGEHPRRELRAKEKKVELELEI
jgi:hypothetical protein